LLLFHAFLTLDNEHALKSILTPFAFPMCTSPLHTSVIWDLFSTLSSLYRIMALVSCMCFCYFRQLSLIIHQSLPLHVIRTLVHALICASIDYGVYRDLLSTSASKL